MPELGGEGRVIKRFRVAREGQTVDGRVLTRQEIVDIAETYNPVTYGARINVEHIAGYSPEPPFNAYGDVVLADYAIEDGRACLYNTISALPNLQVMNKAGQKLYPSIEFIRDFSGTGRAYQVGLAMTDNPASLGTQPLKFTAGGQTLHTHPSTEIFIMSQPTQNQQQNQAVVEKTLLEKLTAIVTGKTDSPAAEQTQSPELLKATADAVTVIADSMKSLATTLGDMAKRLDKVEKQVADDIKADLQEGQQNQSANPPVTAQPPAQTTQTEPTEPTMKDLLAAIGGLTQALSNTPANGVPPAVTGGGPALPSF